ncbi:phosphate ABC transporter permease PstA [Apilactobacillus xinyiensis]|uniref:phosphate ABC transporter permease PstA n=1 Tax=Apilactobacillus xinyiensis TaxID=2841032 RepID=UPI00200C3FB0|nr:phosphate ABC transporter permease PstA [Apilactobacillus xinyiensis]MCL0319165.1 phosphate ABC transporter permease PstA [Apilactobacillus xinyiensis]
MNPKSVNRIATTVINSLVGVVVALLVLLISYILVTGLPHMSLDFLLSPSQSYQAGGGIRDQLFNSIYLVILTLIISFPIALGAGIYLAEYAPKNWIVDVIRTLIEVLSSLPSVVVGLFAYLVFVIKFQVGFSIISGAVALTIFNLPLLTRNIEDSIKSVPDFQMQGALALGLSKWTTIIKIIFPSAIPGIITGIILSSGRIFGEAAALIYTSGQSAPILNYANWNPFSPDSFLNPMRPAETLAVHIWKVNSEGITPDANAISSGASAVLILVIILFNFFAHWIGKKLYKKFTVGEVK